MTTIKMKMEDYKFVIGSTKCSNIFPTLNFKTGNFAGEQVTKVGYSGQRLAVGSRSHSLLLCIGMTRSSRKNAL